jgi:hypothetical protein
MDIQIDNYVLPQDPLIVKRIRIKLIELEFNNSAKFLVSFYSSDELYDNNIIKTQVVIIEGEEYLGWSNDDDYIINLICQKLGIKKSIAH